MKLVIAFIIALFNISAAPQSSDTALIRKMMEVTGAVSSLTKMGADLEKDIYKYNPNADSDEIEVINDHIAAVYNPDSLISRYIKNNLKVFNREKTEEVLKVYQNPVFIKATELESRDMTDEEVADFIKNFDSTNYSEQRLALIERIKTAGRVSDFTYYAMKSSIQVALTVNSALSGEDNAAETQNLADLILQQTQPEMDHYITMTMLLCYKDLSDDELKEYVEYYETPLGKWNTEVSITSHLNTLSESADLFTKTFPSDIKARKS